MMRGSWSARSVPLTNGFGSWRSQNLRIRIRNTGFSIKKKSLSNGFLKLVPRNFWSRIRVICVSSSVALSYNYFCVYCTVPYLIKGRTGLRQGFCYTGRGRVGEGLGWDPHSWNNYLKLYIVLDSVLWFSLCSQTKLGLRTSDWTSYLRIHYDGTVYCLGSNDAVSWDMRGRVIVGMVEEVLGWDPQS